jgi:SAM-dependent methyltransferase
MQRQSHSLMVRKEIWERKIILRKRYQYWCRIIKSALRPGSILEIGGGSGNLKEFFPDAISTDIVFTPWTDAVLDAHYLPFHDLVFDNIILFDVLHHLYDPVKFFYEVQNVLKTNGRLVLMEPYISWSSFFIYRYLHPENLTMNMNPFNKNRSDTHQNHFRENQAIPSLIFERYRNQFAQFFPNFNIITIKRMDYIIYPLSGGFHHSNLCPLFLYPILEYLEKLLYPLNRLLAFRLFVVLEKT